MKFEVLRDKAVLFHTSDITCVPPINQINAMLKAGYKIKINDKVASKTGINKLSAFKEE